VKEEPAMQFEVFRVDDRGDGVAVVTIDRPEKRNAMSVAFFKELPRVLDHLWESGIRVAVLTGAGDEAFSAGGDIASFDELTDIHAYRRQLRMVYEAFHAVERSEVVVIGAVNGIAYGGGTELSLACDIVFASDRARFAFREATVGLMPGYGVIRGPEVIGRHWTRILALSGEIIDAGTAERIGLVQRVVPHDALLDEALAMARTIASRAPMAVTLGKQFINRGLQSPGVAESIEATALLFTTADHKAGVKAFLGRTNPEFQGR
jgi:enoyl-CoA hydratase